MELNHKLLAFVFDLLHCVVEPNEHIVCYFFALIILIKGVHAIKCDHDELLIDFVRVVSTSFEGLFNRFVLGNQWVIGIVVRDVAEPAIPELFVVEIVLLSGGCLVVILDIIISN